MMAISQENTTETDGKKSEPLMAPDLSLTTVLIVEDQPTILSLIADCMHVIGVGQVIRASSAEAAQEIVSSIEKNPTQAGIANIDFAIIDWNLYGNPFAQEEHSYIQGPELCRWLRQIEFCRFMPILAISAYASNNCVKDMIDSGVSGFISKPFSVHDLSRQSQSLCMQLRPFVVTPSGYLGPDRRRKQIEFKTERRRTQNGVKHFNPPRTLRQKVSKLVEVSEDGVAKVMQQMREIVPPDYRELVATNIDKINMLLGEVPKELNDANSIKLAREKFDEINCLCNEILKNPGGFTYQMVAETMAAMSRFIGDKYFTPSAKAVAIMNQQLATLTIIVARNMKGPATGEMRHLFAETYAASKRVLSARRNEKLGLKG